MDVRCEKCSTEYEFDEDRIGANGVTVKCTACGFVFKVRRPRKIVPPPRATTTLGKGPQGREWLVRKPDGQMIAFRELTTLQKWIVEGRIARDDEISKNGETWKRLGNILELEPFFSVYEKARALNDLIERGGAEGTPVELRGSEVLAAMSPISSIALEGGSIPPSITGTGSGTRGEIIGPEYAHASSLSPTQRAVSAPSAAIYTSSSAASLQSPLGPPPPPPLSHQVSPADPQLAGSMAELAGPPPRPASSNGFGAGGTGSMARRPASSPAAMPPLGASMPPLSATIPPAANEGLSTGFAGPGALNAPSETPFAPPPPRAASRREPPMKDTLSIPIDVDDDGPKSDVVERFERQQKTRRFFGWAVFLIVLGAGGGIALAKFGPSGNPLQVFAERYGLLQPRIIDDGATKHLEEAQRAIDLDTLGSLQKAEGLFELAEKMRAGDPSIRGDRALVMIVRAEALRRAAADMGAAADDAERIKSAWQAQVNAAKEKSPAQPLPPEPSTSDAGALRAELAKNSEQASNLLKQAFDLAASAYKAAPEAFEPARALSEYYRVQQDTTSYSRELARAKSVMEKSGATDAAMLYGEAAALMNLARPSADDLAKASQLLEQALSTRPSMNRARVLLARLELSRQNAQKAKAQLERVLASAPDHQEARWLKDVASRSEQKAEPAQQGAQPAQPAQQQPAQQQPPPAQQQPPQSAQPAQQQPPPSGQQQPAAQQQPAKDDRATKDLNNGAKMNYEGFMSLADRQRERDHPRQALQAYERAADLKPGSAEPLVGMGWSYIDLEKPEAALSMFRRALRANDRFAEAYYGQAEAHRLLGHKQEAIESYEQYLNRAPNGADRKAAQKALEQLKQ